MFSIPSIIKQTYCGVSDPTFGFVGKIGKYIVECQQ